MLTEIYTHICLTMRYIALWQALFIVVLGLACAYNISPQDIVKDRQDSHCAQRSGMQCCPGRNDSCIVVTRSSNVCYCDMYCNRTKFDCCHDFWSHCIYQATEPEHIKNLCTENLIDYKEGAVIKRNCNKCVCVQNVTKEGGVYSWSCDKSACLMRSKNIKSINHLKYGWNASNYSQFWGLTLSDGIRRKLGTFKPRFLTTRMTPLRVRFNNPLPEEFDARKKWVNQIHDVRDQGNCGASWAFSTADMAADRLSIQSLGSLDTYFSPQHLISCNTHGQKGCNGGHIDRAWWFFRKKGVVTEDCYPYHSGTTMSRKRCEIKKKKQSGRCPGKGSFQRQNMYKSTPPYRISRSENDIMKEIYNNGPVQAIFFVRDDFYSYKSGVYRYTGLSMSDPMWFKIGAYHSVRIIGWGIERSGRQPIKYWLCANSWGRSWGESGYFRILRGVNECEIESFVLGVWARAPIIARRRHWRNRQKYRRRRVKSRNQ